MLGIWKQYETRYVGKSTPTMFEDLGAIQVIWGKALIFSESVSFFTVVHWRTIQAVDILTKGITWS
jgi:hypothetical protein